MRAQIRSFPIVAFLVLTYSLTWGAWGFGYLLIENPNLLTVAVIVGGFGPMVAAAIVVRATGESVREWLRTLLKVRIELRWYLVALGLPLLFPVGLTIWMAARGEPLYPELLVERVPWFFGALVGAFLVGGGQEEFGWRGFLLPRLQQQFSAFESSLIVGAVWALWHLPLYVVPTAVYTDRPFGPYILVVIGLAVVLTWLYNNTAGAIPAAMLMHAGVNSANVFVPVSRGFLETSQNLFFYTVVQAGIAVLLAGTVVYMYGPETLTRDSAVEKYRHVQEQIGAATNSTDN